MGRQCLRPRGGSILLNPKPTTRRVVCLPLQEGASSAESEGVQVVRPKFRVGLSNRPAEVVLLRLSASRLEGGFAEASFWPGEAASVSAGVNFDVCSTWFWWGGVNVSASLYDMAGVCERRRFSVVFLSSARLQPTCATPPTVFEKSAILMMGENDRYVS
jgi:hypothetical protein